MKKTQKQGFMGQAKGFTLIEICIAMLIIGVMLAPALMTYNIEMKQRQKANIDGAFIRINDAMSKYVSRFGRYPRPASLLLGQDSDDVNFGVEGPIAPAACPDMITDGMCITGGADVVYIGAVPFNELQLDYDITLDPWGNKIIYAVTASQTDAATYTTLSGGAVQAQALNSYTGAIMNLDEDIPNGLASLTDLDMVLVSTGPSRKGGYSADGTPTGICVEPGNPEYEDENCNWDNTFLLDQNDRTDSRNGPADPNDTQNQEFNGTRSSAPGPRFYDDFTMYVISIQRGDWNENEVLGQYVESGALYTGIAEPEPVAGLHVAGTVGIADDPATVAIEGELHANEICEPGVAPFGSPAVQRFSPGRCFQTSMIASNAALPQMNCLNRSRAGAGLEPVVAIGSNGTMNAVGCGTTSLGSGASTDPFIEPGIDGLDLGVALNPGSCPSGVESIVINAGKVEFVCQ